MYFIYNLQMKKLVVFLLLFSSSLLFSQSDKQIYSIGGNVIVKGRVTCEHTGEPVETELEFRASNGKKIRTKSNSITGNWEQVLPSDNYKVILHSWNVARKTCDLVVQPSEKYKEIHQDFTVKRLLLNDIYLQSYLFKSNSADLMSDFSDIASEIKEVLKYNRAVELTFYVSASDMNKPVETKIIADDKTQSNPKSSKKTAKKQQQTQTETVKAPDYTKLLNQRYSVLKSYVSEHFPENTRVNVAIDIDGKYSRYPNNFSIVVTNNYDIFGTNR